MPFLGKTRWKCYEVTLSDGDDTFTELIMAQDTERAAWTALELSSHRNCTLKDVRQQDEW